MPESARANVGPVPPNNLPAQRRVITTHTADGKSVFDNSVPQEVPVQMLDPTALAHLTYAAKVSPTLTNDADLINYGKLLKDPPGLTIPDTTILRAYDMAPGNESPLHRTKSIDYLVVLYGEMELTLDSGEKQVIRPGEVVIQRGTLHAWKNISSGWSRMLAITIPVNSLVVGGEVKGEELGGIVGLKDSE